MLLLSSTHIKTNLAGYLTCFLHQYSWFRDHSSNCQFSNKLNWPLNFTSMNVVDISEEKMFPSITFKKSLIDLGFKIKDEYKSSIELGL